MVLPREKFPPRRTCLTRPLRHPEMKAKSNRGRRTFCSSRPASGQSLRRGRVQILNLEEMACISAVRTLQDRDPELAQGFLDGPVIQI
jgi:hypothetical protein